LAYVAEAPVNWCPELGTVLANEEVVDGKSEVGGFPVVRKPMRQWMLRITAFAERLLYDLETIDWSPSLKEMQRNWIGRSEGAEVTFVISAGETGKTQGPLEVTVFTTRPDTLFGATYMVLAPENKLVEAITTAEHRSAVESYRSTAAGKSDLERTELAKEKTGVFTGAYAINPVNGERIQIWIADYVLATYGTGAIMAVPAHDTRDLEFAQKFDLPVRQVVQAPAGQESIGFIGDGVNVNSGFLNGLPTSEAKKKIIAWLEEKGCGRKTIHYKLRDWLFSRQRYWGEPFPIVWKDGHHEALPESALPVLPPDLKDFKPTPSGEPPLARVKDWVHLPDGSMRETNTMPQWAGSCWYYLRFIDPHNNKMLCDPTAEHYWMGTQPTATIQSQDSIAPHSSLTPGVDLYVGGTEHAVLHLLYARFWHKVLFDLGCASTPEPFFKLVNQGLVLGQDGQKMSKSRGNVVNPDDIMAEYGADAFRLYEMFMGPLEMVKPWNTKGVEGVYRFLGRVWRLFVDDKSDVEFEQALTAQGKAGMRSLAAIRLGPSIQQVEPTPVQLKALHTCAKKVTEDLDALRFNTAISALMIFVNEAMTWEVKPRLLLRDFLILLHPFAPHLAEELFAKVSRAPSAEKVNSPADGETQTGFLDDWIEAADSTMAYAPWPRYDPALLVESQLEIPVQVNGKLRDRIIVPATATEEELRSAALAGEKVKPFLSGKSIKKIIIITRKLVNIVVE
jgi:leucyl-tRNA synthetase